MASKTVIIIAGPTAVGKTKVAIDVASHFSTEIISADSRQCYRELRIGVARPTVDELSQVRHHFIASHSIQDEITAAGFETFALETANQLFRKHDIIVMTGGTGLYIKAFCEGLDAIPGIDSDIRNDIISQYELKGIDWLQQQLEEMDPVFAKTGEMKNPQRMMRALEVRMATGKSIIEFRRNEKAARDFNIIRLGLELPRELLKNRIDQRVDNMVNEGLIEEVRSLVPYKDLNALQTVGYREIFDALEGKMSMEDAIERIKINTRQYAKRQMTWFRKDSEIKWFSPGDVSGIISSLVNSGLGSGKLRG